MRKGYIKSYFVWCLEVTNHEEHFVLMYWCLLKKLSQQDSTRFDAFNSSLYDKLLHCLLKNRTILLHIILVTFISFYSVNR
jgi:Cu/Ag efflux pump CusA